MSNYKILKFLKRGFGGKTFFKKFFSQGLVFFLVLIFLLPKIVFAEELKPIDAVLVLDVSLSMRTADPERVSRDAMNLFIEKLTEGRDRVGIVSYAGRVERSLGLTEILTYECREYLWEVVGGLEYASWTDHGVGLVEAVRILEAGFDENRQGVVIFLTDGNMNVNPWGDRTNELAQEDVYAAIYAARAMNAPIHTIGLNFDGNLAIDYVNLIAEATHGLAFETAYAGDIYGIIEAFFDAMVAAPQTREVVEFLLETPEIIEENPEEILEESPEEPSEEIEAYAAEDEVSPNLAIYVGGTATLLVFFALIARILWKNKRVFTGKLKYELFNPETRITTPSRTKNLIEYGTRATLAQIIELPAKTPLDYVILMPSPTAPSHLPQLFIRCRRIDVKFTKDFIFADISKGISISAGTEFAFSCETTGLQVRVKYFM